MQFNRHSNQEGQHSVLSASQYAWIRYSDGKFIETMGNRLQAMKGTQLHEFAAMAIRLGQKAPRSHTTMNMYINDAIGFRMTPELVLYYSPNAFCTVDAISFKNGMLRIHDLKTGVGKVNVNQLEIYAAYFCLEYNVRPGEIDIELRIYQNDEVQVFIPDTNDIVNIMGTVVKFDNIYEDMKAELFG